MVSDKINIFVIYQVYQGIKMAKKIKCKKCGEIFKKPIFGLKPLEYKVGIKAQGGFVALGAIIVCPKCGFEGPLSDYEPVEDK